MASTSLVSAEVTFLEMYQLEHNDDEYHYVRVGYDSAFGFVSGCFQTQTRDSALVKVLLDLGAILYVKTTTPPGTMLWATRSNVSSEVPSEYQ